ncbi:two-component system sensor histidine kinase NtrB [Granulicella tundricola]|uniref:histidine kinase n=1 Tax=Granulicella tundricola (strain ATCC BAA-1859 / DSM 23138 / MP5ACTX9) TaxID=1198114 RepID=E8X7C4_GRATM|nr:ATP-binding protein [Granulicella tundricola]ADW71358.1 PAS/PAC sensor signal transduction histidine kinase [Granulicella tundricola MP5ACTX9]
MKFADKYESEPAAIIRKSGAAIFLADSLEQQDVLMALGDLKIATTILGPQDREFHHLRNFEFIVADHLIAKELVLFFEEHEADADGISPAVIAVTSNELEDPSILTQEVCNFDGVLKFPMTGTEISARLSVIMHAHCAFAKRYSAAWRELRLNRRIFRSVTAGISVASATLPDLPIVYVNPAFEEMTGYSRAEVQGRNCRFLEGNERSQPALAIVRDALKNRRKGLAVLKNFRKDGTPFWNELSLSPIMDDEGQLTHYVGIQTDVTQRVELESALRESEKLAAVGRLASSIAHEINNPLTSVMNLIYLAQGTDPSQETKDYLVTADRELRRVKLITEQSLRFFRQSTKAQPTTAAELLEPILDLYQSHATNARVTINLRERPSRPIVCMESEIRQVLSNLVGNAIHAMQERGGQLSLRSRETRNHGRGRDGLLFTVADSGTGMSAEILSSIYKAFYTTKGIGGTGLGLWISSEIVARHRGNIRVKSTQSPGSSGTVFEVFLPFDGIAPYREGVDISQFS